MSTTKVCLNWQEFQTNALGSLQEAKDNSEFCDVTLISEDGQNTKAHQLILSASSNIFKSMLTGFPSPKPLIFLRGIKGKELLSIIEYIYKGEVSINQEGMEDFLSIAVALQIKGLYQSQKDNGILTDNIIKREGGICTDQFEDSQKEATKEATGKIVRKRNIKLIGAVEKAFLGTDKTKIKETCTFLYNDQMDGCCTVYSNTEKNALNDKVKKFQTKSGSGKTLQIFCNVCNKSWKNKSHGNEHVEIHIEGLHFYCHDCDFTATSSHSMRGHKKRMKPNVFETNKISNIEDKITEELISIHVDNSYQFQDNDMFSVSYQ